MKMLDNFFKKINKPAPAFNQTKLEKETPNDNSDSSKPKTTFNDVAGLEEVKEELFEIVDFMKSPDKYKKMGAKIPKGVLFYGPPGLGKTTISTIIANEMHSNIKITSGPAKETPGD